MAESASADDTRKDQWHLNYLRISEAHKVTRGEGVTVAVIDTGVDPHRDLRKNLLEGTTVMEGETGNGHFDHDGHGTMMAGIIAGHGSSPKDGVLGIAPAAKILPIKDSSPTSNGSGITLADGIEWASTRGADVINVSSISGPVPSLDIAIETAAKRDILVVAGAGNKRTTVFFGFPAAIPGVLAVGSTDRSGKLAKFTVTGKQMDICAPGVDIPSTGPKGKYFDGSGTSQSTAVVSGAAALVRAKFPDLSAPEVIHRLQATATDIGKPGRDEECGFGVLNVVKALTADVPPLTPTTSTPPTTPSSGPAPTTSNPGTSTATPNTTPASSNTPAIIGGSVIVLLFGGLIAMLVNRRRKNPPPM